MRVVCTRLLKNGKTIGSPDVWTGVSYQAVVDGVLHDLQAIPGSVIGLTYMTHLANWLTSGDHIDIMYLGTPVGVDIWQYDNEEDDDA